MDLLDEIKILREETAWREEGQGTTGMHDFQPYARAGRTDQAEKRDRQEGHVTKHTSSALVVVVGIVSLPSSRITAFSCPIASSAAS